MGLDLISKIVTFCLLVLIIGCECSPDINTPRDVDPENSANVAFFNVTDSYNSLSIRTDDYEIIEGLLKNDNLSSYEQIEPFFSNVIISDSDEEIVRVPIETKPESNYTGLIFEISNNVDLQIAEIENIPTGNNSNFLLFNSNLLSKISINFGHEEVANEILVNEYSFSNQITVEAKDYNFKIYDKDDSELLDTLINFKLNTVYTIFYQHNHISNKGKLRLLEVNQ